MKHIILLVFASVIFLNVQGCGLSTDSCGFGEYFEKELSDDLWVHTLYDTVYLDIYDFGYGKSTYSVNSVFASQDSIHLLLTAESGSYYNNVVGADTSLQWIGDTLTLRFGGRVANTIAVKDRELTYTKGKNSPDPLCSPKAETLSITHITFELPKNKHIVMLDTSRWKLK